MSESESAFWKCCGQLNYPENVRCGHCGKPRVQIVEVPSSRCLIAQSSNSWENAITLWNTRATVSAPSEAEDYMNSAGGSKDTDAEVVAQYARRQALEEAAKIADEKAERHSAVLECSNDDADRRGVDRRYRNRRRYPRSGCNRGGERAELTNKLIKLSDPARAKIIAESQSPAKPARYNVAQRTAVGDLSFQSKKEANRYVELKQAERAGEISHLSRQVRFPLVVDGVKIFPRGYYADFVYIDHGRRGWKLVVEDTKGMKDEPIYLVKKNLMLAIWGITILET
jgi:hypothetical protein